MNITHYRSEPERANIFTVRVSDRDILARRQFEDLQVEIRTQLASRIVDKIMQRIDPAIENIFKESNNDL